MGRNSKDAGGGLLFGIFLAIGLFFPFGWVLPEWVGYLAGAVRSEVFILAGFGR